MRHRLAVFDVDGVLCDFVRAFTTLLAVGRGQDLSSAYGTGAQQHWDFNGTPEELRAAWERVNNSDRFWATLLPLVTDSEKLDMRRLATRCDIKFVTNRPSVTSKEQTEYWLTRHGILLGEVIQVHGSKREVIDSLNPIAIIDDSPHVIGDLTSHPLYIRDYPYNRGLPGLRVSSVTEYVHAVEGALTRATSNGTME